MRELNADESEELKASSKALYELSKKHEEEHKKNEQQRYEEALHEDSVFIRTSDHPYRF